MLHSPQAVVEEVGIVEGVAQLFYDRIEATCKGKGPEKGSIDGSSHRILTSLGRVVGLFQKPADLEDASTPENKFEKERESTFR